MHRYFCVDDLMCIDFCVDDLMCIDFFVLMTSCASIFCVDDLMCIDFFEVDGLKKSCASILLLDFDFLVLPLNRNRTPED